MILCWNTFTYLSALRLDGPTIKSPEYQWVEVDNIGDSEAQEANDPWPSNKSEPDWHWFGLPTWALWYPEMPGGSIWTKLRAHISRGKKGEQEIWIGMDVLWGRRESVYKGQYAFNCPHVNIRNWDYSKCTASQVIWPPISQHTLVHTNWGGWIHGHWLLGPAPRGSNGCVLMCSYVDMDGLSSKYSDYLAAYTRMLRSS